ncbi:hypothetical protein GCM10020220_068570 [Nonomuraea rubra]
MGLGRRGHARLVRAVERLDRRELPAFGSATCGSVAFRPAMFRPAAFRPAGFRITAFCLAAHEGAGRRGGCGGAPGEQPSAADHLCPGW